MKADIKADLLRLIVAMGCIVSTCGELAFAQTLIVKLVDAKSGKPMGDQNLTVRWVDSDSSVLALDESGSGRVKVPQGAKEFVMLPGPRKGSEPNRVAFMNCNQWPSPLISVAEAVRTGIVPKNTCGAARANSHAGEIVFWALPRPFWDFQ